MHAQSASRSRDAATDELPPVHALAALVIQFSRMRSTWQRCGRADRPTAAIKPTPRLRPNRPPRMMCMSADHEGSSWRKDCPEIHLSERLWMQVRGLEISSLTNDDISELVMPVVIIVDVGRYHCATSPRTLGLRLRRRVPCR